MTTHRLDPMPLLIVALTLALNLYGLAADSFWGDEILTASFASRPAGEIVRWTARDIHPPLYYLLAGGFTALTVPLGSSPNPGPVSDWLWRFPSVLAVVLAVAATCRLVRLMMATLPDSARQYSDSVAASAALLLTLSPTVLKYGQEARMHALFMALAVFSTLLLFQALHRPRRWPRWGAYGLATSAMLYTMYFGFLILAAQTAYVLSCLAAQRQGESPPSPSNGSASSSPPPNLPKGREGKQIPPAGGPGGPKSATNLTTSTAKPQLIGFSAAVLFSLALYSPWWPVLFGLLRRRAAVGAIEGGVGAPLAFVSGVIEALGPLPLPAAWGFLLLFAIGLIFLARQRWPLAVLAGLWLALPAALPLLLGDPRALQFRYAFILPLYLSVIAYAAWHLAGRWAKTRADHQAQAHYLIWILATVSFIGMLGIYQQTKPNWRAAAAYLDAHVHPGDLILIGPLWDEGRFIDYYYTGQAPLLTPAAIVANIEGRARGLRASGGRVWAVNRFAPDGLPGLRNVAFSGVVVSEPELAVYEPEPLAQAALSLAQQAVEAAYPWAAAAEAQGVLDPDPRTARAAALRALGDALLTAGRPAEAVHAYQTAVDIFPGWVSGFIALAEAQEAAGNLPAAAQAYRQAVGFNLEWQGPAAERAGALVETGDWGGAVRIYKKIVEN